ncbi:unnamed protein product, partial [Protopolystoma xenopodis]
SRATYDLVEGLSRYRSRRSGVSSVLDSFNRTIVSTRTSPAHLAYSDRFDATTCSLTTSPRATQLLGVEHQTVSDLPPAISSSAVAALDIKNPIRSYISGVGGDNAASGTFNAVQTGSAVSTATSVSLATNGIVAELTSGRQTPSFGLTMALG